LLVSFTLRKIWIYFSSFGTKMGGRSYEVAFTWSLRSSGTSSVFIRMIEGHYFKIVKTICYSNWNSITSGFHYATHLVWLQGWHPLQYKGVALVFWIYNILCMVWFVCKLKRYFAPLSFWDLTVQMMVKFGIWNYFIWNLLDSN
jgi:hypothetical protein